MSSNHRSRKTVHHQADVAASPAALYALIANAQRRVEWLPELDSTDAPSRPLQPGDRFEATSSILAHEFLGCSEVTEAAAGSSLEEVVVIGARMRTRWELAPLPDGTTRVTHILHVDFPGGPFGRLERWVLGRRLARMQREGLARLRRLAESAASPSGHPQRANTAESGEVV